MLSKFAKQHSASGALAFANYYFKAEDWSLATNDAYLLKRISSPRCIACKRLIDRLDALNASGGHVQGGRILVRSSILATGGDIKADYVVDVKTTQQPDVIYRPGEAPSTEATKSTNYGSFVYVSWVSGGWKVVEVEADS